MERSVNRRWTEFKDNIRSLPLLRRAATTGPDTSCKIAHSLSLLRVLPVKNIVNCLPHDVLNVVQVIIESFHITR